MPLSSLLQAFKSKDKHPEIGRLRVAVLGAGRMGQFHLKHLARSKAAALIGVLDANPEQARLAARKFRTEAFTDSARLRGLLDAVIVATPTPSHYEVARQFLGQGVSCLIEKPLASTVEEAEALIQLAAQNQCVLQVGHIERFNPAVMEAVKHIDHPQFIEVNRLGPFDPRVAEIGVVLDLMIHDLDIVLFLVNRPVRRVEAFGAKVLSRHEDIAKVRIHFEGGCIADLSASRISLKKYRRIRVFQHNAYLSLDYALPELKVYRKKSELVRSLSDVQVITPRLPKHDPLGLEISHFLECVKEKRPPLVAGEHGRDALQLAQEILKQLRVYV